MFQLCLRCVKDSSLKRLINEKGRGDGWNLTLFDPDNCQYIEEDSSVYYITKLIYEYEKQPQISKDYIPILDYNDNWIHRP